jgi:hypothetical protein
MCRLHESLAGTPGQMCWDVWLAAEQLLVGSAADAAAQALLMDFCLRSPAVVSAADLTVSFGRRRSESCSHECV